MAIEHYDDQTQDILIHVVPELRQRLKRAAAQSHLSVQEYLERILEQTIPSETSPPQKRTERLNRAAVDKLLQTREAIKQAHPDQVFEDSSELVYQARQERMQELEQK